MVTTTDNETMAATTVVDSDNIYHHDYHHHRIEHRQWISAMFSVTRTQQHLSTAAICCLALFMMAVVAWWFYLHIRKRGKFLWSRHYNKHQQKQCNSQKNNTKKYELDNHPLLPPHLTDDMNDKRIDEDIEIGPSTIRSEIITPLTADYTDQLVVTNNDNTNKPDDDGDEFIHPMLAIYDADELRKELQNQLSMGNKQGK